MRRRHGQDGGSTFGRVAAVLCRDVRRVHAGHYGLLDYGYETTILAQKGNLLVRVSAAKTPAIMTAILAKL